MTVNWERRHEFVQQSDTTLQAMLQQALPGKRVASAQLLTTGYCNTNYKVTLDGLQDSVVLRLYVRDQNACQKDIDIFQLVHEHVPVPELLYADSSGTQFGIPYAIHTWIDGTLLSEILVSDRHTDMAQAAYAVGTTLASIGTYTFPCAGFFGPGLSIAQPFHDNTYLEVIEQFLFQELTGQRLGPGLTDRLWKFVNENASLLEAIKDDAALVHSDYKGINILMRRNPNGWQTAGVLDWEFAFASSPLNDIANILRYEHLYPTSFAQQFIQGFLTHGGSLPPGWRKIAKLLDLISLCDFLNVPAGQRDSVIEDVTGLIIRTLDRW